MIAKGKTPIQESVAAAYHSPFALGGGKFHIEGYEGYADTVFLGAPDTALPEPDAPDVLLCKEPLCPYAD